MMVGASKAPHYRRIVYMNTTALLRLSGLMRVAAPPALTIAGSLGGKRFTVPMPSTSEMYEKGVL